MPGTASLTARVCAIFCVMGMWGAAMAASPARQATDIAMLDALTWGVNGSSLAAFRAMGSDEWLQAQLHPTGEASLPEEARKQIDALSLTTQTPFDRVVDFQKRAGAVAQILDADEKVAAARTIQLEMNEISRQAAARFILRALYAPDQLRERMVWFWFNHFNVAQSKANLRLLVGDYENVAIRPHALGRFRDLLEATVRHPAMLRYLDNAENAVGRSNENYAREILERHTMGAGSGYSQKDVEEFARILTGVGIDLRPADPPLPPPMRAQFLRDGLFEFNPARHDAGDKIFLGRPIKGGRGFAEVEEALDILAAEPATARHISRQITTYFVADAPPAALVERMAARFRETGGDIARVLETMIRSPEFSASLGARFKDPMRYVLSAVRLAYDGKVILNTGPVLGWLQRLGESPYNRSTPDGYPLVSAFWSGPGQMMARFEVAKSIGASAGNLFKPAEPDVAATPAFPLLQNALYFEQLRGMLSARTMAALAQADSPQMWNLLFLSSPEFMNLKPW